MYLVTSLFMVMELGLLGNREIRLVKYFSIKNSEAYKSELLNSYGTHQPRGPNLRLSMRMECKKHTVNIMFFQKGWSTLSINYWFIIVVKVL